MRGDADRKPAFAFSDRRTIRRWPIDVHWHTPQFAVGICAGGYIYPLAIFIFWNIKNGPAEIPWKKMLRQSKCRCTSSLKSGRLRPRVHTV
ncbi:hypothetical protein HYPSUDRAFT_604881 [Hypholoma sublateritium FD-334 SS-4]|uniref:Uncharacterized protein n=1 Tax=Hypholoma sublateritium (strain FD-334 SS-4) TaxID=945553 RepID=A0A0D2NWM7_HYPSF|nr:hypothetical protein HYPSUDRAFT_604881 [Hypholoma sublateritium FD-334 SS-4]